MEPPHPPVVTTSAGIVTVTMPKHTFLVATTGEVTRMLESVTEAFWKKNNLFLLALIPAG